jgi:hypothetical protein
MTEEREHYWICTDCAEKRGLKPVDWAVTCVLQACPYCGEEKMLACKHTDFTKDGVEPKVWD